MEDRNVQCFDQTLIGPGDKRHGHFQENLHLLWSLQCFDLGPGPHCRHRRSQLETFNRIGDYPVPLVLGETQLDVLTVSLCTDVSISNKISKIDQASLTPHISSYQGINLNI